MEETFSHSPGSRCISECGYHMSVCLVYSVCLTVLHSHASTFACWICVFWCACKFCCRHGSGTEQSQISFRLHVAALPGDLGRLECDQEDAQEASHSV